MKTLFLTAAAAALIFTAPAAFAADDHHGHPGGGGGEHAAHAAPANAARVAPTHTARVPATTMGGPAHVARSHGGMRTTTAAPSFGKTERKGRDNAGIRDGNGGNGARGGNGTHVTINFNRHNVTASHHYRYRGGAYRGPSGYSYHRYSYGETFPSIYFGRDYWIDDYSDYGLSDPPDGCVWVRYGDDAVLVDEDDGEILEVVYGQFY